jgi:ATP-dependent Clp protease ATP-binding subunit ClpA
MASSLTVTPPSLLHPPLECDRSASAWHSCGVFERFTDRARRVLVLAQEEARLLGHPMLGSEHILLGLVAEEGGVASTVLSQAGVDLVRAREEVDRLVGGLGRADPGSSPPFTPRAKKALEHALRAALSLGHSFIGTEHLLLGVLDEEDTMARRALHALGADADDLRHRVADAIGTGLPDLPPRSENSRLLRVHVLEGLLRAIELYGEIAEAAAHCTSRAEAKEVLTRLPFRFSEVQTDHVLDLTVASVTDERRRRLADELAALKSEGPRS